MLGDMGPLRGRSVSFAIQLKPLRRGFFQTTGVTMNDQNSKAAYEAPRLIEYGSVRNLTGGSGAQGSDGGTTMSMMA